MTKDAKNLEFTDWIYTVQEQQKKKIYTENCLEGHYFWKLSCASDKRTRVSTEHTRKCQGKAKF